MSRISDLRRRASLSEKMISTMLDTAKEAQLGAGFEEPSSGLIEIGFLVEDIRDKLSKIVKITHEMEEI